MAIKEVIAEKNYTAHGGKGELIRDLTQNLVEEKMAAGKVDSLFIAIKDLRVSIMDTVFQTTGKPLVNNNEVENALLGDKSKQDGEVIIARIAGKRTALFGNKEAMLILEMILNKKQSPLTTKKAMVYPFQRVG